jgi:hypothetical protein
VTAATWLFVLSVAALGITGALDVRRARAAEGRSVLRVAADLDDDDLDGTPDSEQPVVDRQARADLVPIDAKWVGSELRVISGGQRARLLVGGRPVPWSTPLVPGTMVQGRVPGNVQIVAVRGGAQTPLTIQVVGVSFRDGARKTVSATREWMSLARTPPSRVEVDPDAGYDDFDALRVVLELPEDEPAPQATSLETMSAAGTRIDVLPRVPLVPATCRPGLTEARCYATAPIRLVTDDTDRSHPLVAQRSLRGEVGGALVVREGTKKLQAIRVAGPRATPVGPIGRLRATMRPIVMRVAPGGAPAIGGTDAGAIVALRSELAIAAATWGQCGVTFGPAAQLDVKIVSPPPPHLLAIGDDAGLPAGGGELRFRAEGKPIVVPVARGATPDRVAADVAAALDKVGLVGVVSPNARIGPGARGSVDVSVRRRDGTLVALDTLDPATSLTSDPTLSVRVGAVDLSDGLQHFGDMDSVAGTLEERTLLKAIDDGDPQTLEVVVVPFFSGGGRIGESFIASDLSSVRNVVLLDRAGVRARRSSLTLAHELGHVLMDLPGHPDDYGVDTPTLLMDSDASDASPFGPRRLTIDECVRVVKQAGPKARVPLLQEWKLTPLSY